MSNKKQKTHFLITAFLTVFIYISMPSLAEANIQKDLESGIKQGNLKLTEILLTAGAKPNFIYPSEFSSFTPIDLAVGNKEMVKLLIKYGANVKWINDEEWSLLMTAAKEGYFDIAQILIEKGVDINYYSYDGSTALGLAAWQGHSDIVQLLLDNKANPNIKSKENGSPLQRAIQSGYTSIAEILLKHGAKY